MKIGVVGTGYVGLVSGTCFAEFGIDVVCLDTDATKIERLQNGEIPIFEPGLDLLVEKQTAAGRLSFTTDIKDAAKGADAIFIAVGTPPRPEDGHADMTYVHQAARDIAANMDGYTVVVTKSTVPVGTAHEVERIIREANPSAEFDVCSNPEFLREGAAINDFMRPDRVVIGTNSERAADVLATKITFINEIADMCEKTGADVQEIARGIGLDKRISAKFLQAGPGYGGSCFPKDTLALTQIGQKHGAPQRVIEAVVEANDERQRQMAQRVIDACGGDVSGKRIAVLGVSFKPNTDDVRAAPSLVIIPILQKAGATVAAYDPAAMEEAAHHLSDVEWCKGEYEAIEGADALVVITEWNEFRGLSLKRIAESMKSKTVIDLRNIYKPDLMAERGFHYVSIGRPVVGGADSAALKAVS